MKRLYLLLVTIIIVFILLYCFQASRHVENFETKGKAQPMLFRATNTILTAANVFTDAMDKLDLPKEIDDEYNEWIEKGFISPVKNQMLCGGCWAFATCGSLADRLTIATAGKWRPDYGLSEQILISCGGEMGMDFYQGCEGGIPHFAIDALTKDGIPADAKCKTGECGGGGAGSGSGGASGGVVGSQCHALPYTWWQTACDPNSTCGLSAASTCPCDEIMKEMAGVTDENNPFDIKYKTVGEAHSYTSHGKNNELQTVDLWPDIPENIIAENVIRMKKAIYYEGPITIGYRVTSDFFSFFGNKDKNNADGYYKYDGRSPMQGGHAVTIVGWKKSGDGTPVWICKNSWGTGDKDSYSGYGFDKPEKDGKKLYPGGFWNHIMGINDSFVESNASGAHPDLQTSSITKFLPNNGKDIPKLWYKTMTLRAVYDMVRKQTGDKSKDGDKPKSKDDDKPKPKDDNKPPISPIDITSDKFSLINLTPDNLSPQAISEFFLASDSRYIIGANEQSIIKELLKLLPDTDKLSQTDAEELARKIQEKISGYLIIGARGDTNNYYYLSGDPQDWNLFTSDYVNRAATIKKLSQDLYYKIWGLRSLAPVVQVSKKESFGMYAGSLPYWLGTHNGTPGYQPFYI